MRVFRLTVIVGILTLFVQCASVPLTGRKQVILLPESEMMQMSLTSYAEWLKLEKKYRPWIDFDNLPFYGRGAGWQRQLHIYECPFYYIDYCLSTMAALQFFLLSLDDHKDAWERYLKLVRRAGLASYTELLQTAGLKVPFEEGSVKGIAQQMTRWLEEHQVD